MKSYVDLLCLFILRERARGTEFSRSIAYLTEVIAKEDERKANKDAERWPDEEHCW